MLFVISGEGSSDLGTKGLDGTLKKGTMTLILDRLCEINCDCEPDYELLTEGDVKRLRKSNPRDVRPRGGVSKEDTETLWLSSYCLAVYAKGKGEGVALVYFKDSDGTNTSPRDKWERMVRAMYSGFKGAEFKWGVAMVPRPKSEAWLLAYYQKNDGVHQAYDQCERFEEMSGNDGSPMSCKSLLKNFCACDDDVYANVITKDAVETIDWCRVNMPSFTTFKKRFENVLAGLNGRPYPHADCPYTEGFLVNAFPS